MKGIVLSFGTVFVTDGIHTLRKTKNTRWHPSPVSYQNVEWDLRAEHPDTWTYLTEDEIKNLSDGDYEKIFTLFGDIRAKVGGKET